MTRETRARYPLFLASTATVMVALFVARAGPERAGESKAGKRFDPIVREIEGFKVHIDPKMLGGEHSAGGAKALTMLASNLLRIGIMIPEDRLKQLQTIGIWIEHDHPEINGSGGRPWCRGSGRSWCR